MIKTPLGEKIIIYASRPGLIVGRKGQNIKELTENLKRKFKLENPQIEISEVENISLDANIVAERIMGALERFGAEKFKAVGHKTMQNVMDAGALGVEIIVSGKIPSSRAKSWRFYQGYLKKCGDIALTGVNKAQTQAKLKTGTVGIKVSIMPPDTKLPDKVELIDTKQEEIEEVKESKEEDKTEKKDEKQAEKDEKKSKTKKPAKKEDEKNES
jgi:small subunit ribosomal protein S3